MGFAWAREAIKNLKLQVSHINRLFFSFVFFFFLNFRKTLISASSNSCMSHLMTKPTKWHVRPAKTQISLGIRPGWSESSLSARWNLGSLATHWEHSEDSDQTGRMPRLLSLRWAHMPLCWFCHEAACISILIKNLKLLHTFVFTLEITSFYVNPAWTNQLVHL